jgi:hypothetical protein
MPKQRFVFSGQACIYDSKTKNFLTPQTVTRYLNIADKALRQAKADFIYIEKNPLDADANFSIDRINETLKQLH